MAQISMTAATTVEDDNARLFELLGAYGYLLQQPDGYRWLAGFLRGEQLQYARQVIEAKYAPITPALTLVERPRRQAAA